MLISFTSAIPLFHQVAFQTLITSNDEKTNSYVVMSLMNYG